MGGLLLAAALALPAALAAVARARRAARRARPVAAMGLGRRPRRRSAALSLALMALLLALAVNVGVGTMVESFRRTFLGYLDQRLAAELYVAGRDDAEAAAIAAWLDAPPRGRRRCCRSGARRRGSPTGRSSSTASATTPPTATTGRCSPPAPDAWDRVARGRGGAGLRAAGPPLRPRPGDDARAAGAGRALDAAGRGGLRRLRQRRGPGDGRGRRARRPLARGRRAGAWPSASRPRPRRALVADLRAAFALAGQPGRRPARAEGGLAPHLREDLRRHRRAQRADAGGRRHRAPDQPPDARRAPGWRSSRRSGRWASPAAGSRRSSSRARSGSPA